MRLSCNGCRVLRKGCSSDCPIRPCLQWIKSPQSQANATLFLAKFYGRAGLINLINAAAPNLRPAAFKSLLQEACGRIVNPIFGCTGLLSSGRWDLCEAAVEAVLIGAPIKQVSSSSSSESESESMLKACDIRHVANKGKGLTCLHKVKSSQKSQFKRSGGKNRERVELEGWVSAEECGSGSGPGSGVSDHASVGNGNGNGNGNGGEGDDSCSVETVEAEASQQLHPACDDDDDDVELDLNLTLGWGPFKPSLDNSRFVFVI